MGPHSFLQSVGSMPAYPSALGTRDSDLSFRTGLSSATGLSSDIDREFSSLKSSMRTDSLLSEPMLKYDPLAKQASAPSYKSSTFSETSSSSNGGVPHRTSHHDSTQRTTRTGDSGIPHTSYSHNSSSFDSDRPYGNRSHNFSYNI